MSVFVFDYINAHHAFPNTWPNRAQMSVICTHLSQTLENILLNKSLLCWKRYVASISKTNFIMFFPKQETFLWKKKTPNKYLKLSSTFRYLIRTQCDRLDSCSLNARGVVLLSDGSHIDTNHDVPLLLLANWTFKWLASTVTFYWYSSERARKKIWHVLHLSTSIKNCVSS